ncbi:MAG: glycine cleavage system protein H [Planctomycetota bacterium]
MSDENLIFMMGEFEAEFPSDRHYCNNHMWVKSEENGEYRFGFSAYAVRLLQDVYFLDWLLDAPSTIQPTQEIGSVESKKAESSLYSPTSGSLIRFNETLMDDPSAINTDKYGSGWLFEMQLPDLDPEFLSPEDYVEMLDSVWIKTQRTIKGQL